MTTRECKRRWHSSIPRPDRHRQACHYLGPACFPMLKAANAAICTASRAVSSGPNGVGDSGTTAAGESQLPVHVVIPGHLHRLLDDDKHLLIAVHLNGQVDASPPTPDEPPLTFPESRCPGEPGKEGRLDGPAEVWPAVSRPTATTSSAQCSGSPVVHHFGRGRTGDGSQRALSAADPDARVWSNGLSWGRGLPQARCAC